MYRFSHCALALIATVLSLGLSYPSPAADKGHDGGTLVIGFSQSPRTLNMAIQSGTATDIPGTQLFASPLRYDADWKPHPYLAKSWELSKDGKSLTLHLVHNAVFHDGKPITSEDVAFSIMTLKAHHPFKTMYSMVEHVDTPDPHTAIIRMSEPNPAILLEMSPALCPILPKHVYGVGDIKTNPHNNHDVVGSGPFKLSEFKPGQYIELKRFDKFFIPGRPHLDRIIIKITPDASTAVLALERGQLDVLASFEGHLKIKRLSKNPRLVMTAKGFEGPGALTWIEFNLARKPFSDLRVRQAIAYAIDKSYITGTIMGGFAQRATGPIVPGSPFYTANVEHYNLDLKRAEALLEEAGYKRGQDGMRLNVTMDAIPTFPERSKNIAEYFKAQLRKVGVNVVVRTSPDFPTWAKRMATHDFEMTVDTVFNWGDPNIGVARTYLTSNIKNIVWTNVMSYSNPKVDEILTEASHEVDFAKRKAMYTSFQKIVVDDLPILYLAVPARRNVYNKDLGDFPTNIWGLLSPLDEVYWKKQPNR